MTTIAYCYNIIHWKRALSMLSLHNCATYSIIDFTYSVYPIRFLTWSFAFPFCHIPAYLGTLISIVCLPLIYPLNVIRPFLFLETNLRKWLGVKNAQLMSLLSNFTLKRYCVLHQHFMKYPSPGRYHQTIAYIKFCI